ncbi:MAG: glycosyltransferase [Limnobacter sp.]|nr:glycosyltransferase [Limnobacter sp.]
MTTHPQPSTPPTVALVLIARNEAPIIERCLQSACNWVQFVLLQDTGSTDGTQEVVTQWLKSNKLPGKIMETPWEDFSWNRNLLLQQATQHAPTDYVFMMDADDELQIHHAERFQASLASLHSDAGVLQIVHGKLVYPRIHVMKNNGQFKYRGVMHEFVQQPPGAELQAIQGASIRANCEGSRSKDPNKYRKDAATLVRALTTETDPFHDRALHLLPCPKPARCP